MDKINKKKLKGFSLLEIIVTIGLLLLLSALVFPTTLRKLNESKARDYASQIVTDVYFQQQRARNEGVPTGIHFELNKYTLFDGDSLSTATEKDIKKLPKGIVLTNINMTDSNSVLFLGTEFKPISFGDLRVTVGLSGVKVNINQEGLIEYDKM